jgi:hypothetical protein
MNAPTRRPDGTMMKGFSANPGGRPTNSIASLRERYLPRLDELMEELWELATNSQSEMVRLAAIREILDRLLGKPAVFVDATHTKVDIGRKWLLYPWLIYPSASRALTMVRRWQSQQRYDRHGPDHSPEAAVEAAKRLTE